MAKEVNIKKTNLKLVIFLILILGLLVIAFYYVYDYSTNTKHGYRRIDAGKNVREAVVEKEQLCKIQLRWNLDFEQVDEIKLTFYTDDYNKYDYTTYYPRYDMEVSAIDLGVESFEKIVGVEAKYYYQAQWPSPNQTNRTEIPSLSPAKSFLEWIRNLFSN